MCSGSVIDSIPENTALFQVYPGAIYLNQGVEYKVKSLCTKTHRAFVEACKVEYYTACRDFTDVEPIRCFEQTLNIWKHGIVDSKTRIVGFYKKARYTSKTIELVSLTLPNLNHTGHGVWLDIPETVLNLIEEKATGFNNLTVPAAAHGINHLIVRIVPIYLLCEPTDLRTSHPAPDQHRTR